MITNIVGKHHVQQFTSLAEFTDWSRSLPDHRSRAIRADRGQGQYYGTAQDLPQLHDLADRGMAREGIKALALAQDRVKAITRDIEDQAFMTVWDVAGADVDVPKFLAGEQECMMDYWSNPEAASQPIVTLVVNVAVHCGITADAFQTHGAALVALAEAIDQTGRQTEIWADFTITSGHKSSKGHTGRFAVRLKAGNGPFDPGAFMFTLTHPGMFRGMVLNAMHSWPEEWRTACSVGGLYGYPAHGEIHIEDYPAGAIYIPAMHSNRDAGTFVEKVLDQLGLAAGSPDADA